ncbi:MAG TPA: hypothetical protein VE664_09330 [Actinomycetes bacterium]|nr:hypothetical protein [Actinomycetes bacterium]
MRRLLLSELGFRSLAIDQDTAGRLLAGRLDPADAPPGYAEVVRFLAAAATPASPHELEGEAAVTAAFVRERLDRLGAGSHSVPRRRPRRRTSRFAVVGVPVAVPMVGGAAAATGTLPGPAQRLVDSVSRTAHPHQPTSSTRHWDVGTARSTDHDQRPAASVGHDGGQPGKARDQVGSGSAGRGATGKATHGAHSAPEAAHGAHSAPKAEPGGAPGKSSAVSHAATSPRADVAEQPQAHVTEQPQAHGRAEGTGRRKASRSRPVAASPSDRSPSPASDPALS